MIAYLGLGLRGENLAKLSLSARIRTGQSSRFHYSWSGNDFFKIAIDTGFGTTCCYSICSLSEVKREERTAVRVLRRSIGTRAGTRQEGMLQCGMWRRRKKETGVTLGTEIGGFCVFAGLVVARRAQILNFGIYWVVPLNWFYLLSLSSQRASASQDRRHLKC